VRLPRSSSGYLINALVEWIKITLELFFMQTCCGYIALIGRPNVGKSTLLNQILQQKISITSRKPQTTRHSILGLKTEGNVQYVYVDTPGIHQRSPKTLNRMMNKTALTVLRDVDVIVFLLDALHWKPDDAYVLQMIQQTNVPCILAVNKIDKVKDKKTLLPWIGEMSARHAFVSIVPLSARTGDQVDVLQQTLKPYMPEGPFLFPESQCTDRSTRFMCAELIREKIFRFCGQELPYSTTVEIESYKDEEKIIRIHALILVDKPNHKQMIIGEKGAKLKEIATLARVDMERLVGKKIFLECWIKVKSGWSDNERILKQLGYEG
jgi:GTP-binding protein Era